MAIGKKVGDFSLKSNGVTITQDANGGLRTYANYEGPATGYGTVVGTLSFSSAGPGAQFGTCTWVGAGFLPKGEIVSGSGSGHWERIAGKHKWRVRVLVRVTDGSVLATDGEVDMASHTYSGKLFEWT